MEFDFTAEDGKPVMWNVIVSENGGGKTTVLQSIALALMGQDGLNELNEFLRQRMRGHEIGLRLLDHKRVEQFARELVPILLGREESELDAIVEKLKRWIDEEKTKPDAEKIVEELKRLIDEEKAKPDAEKIVKELKRLIDKNLLIVPIYLPS